MLPRLGLWLCRSWDLLPIVSRRDNVRACLDHVPLTSNRVRLPAELSISRGDRWTPMAREDQPVIKDNHENL